MKAHGHSNSCSVGTGNFCTKFSNTGTILREIAHVRKRYDNPGESTIWRAPASRADLKVHLERAWRIEFSYGNIDLFWRSS